MNENERRHKTDKIKEDTRMSLFYALQEINEEKDISPCIIIKDRYSSDYFVFNVWAEDLPPIHEDDVSRASYLHFTKDVYGQANTIDKAIKDYIEKHQARRKVLIERIIDYYPKVKPSNADDTKA
jgi:hypothetical protein